MAELTFEEVESQIQKRYQEGEYEQALELATRMAPRFPEQAPLLYYWRVCMAARLEDSRQALQLLGEVLGQGTWYGEVLLRKSPSLQLLQGQPEFERMVERNREIQAADPAQTFPLITLRSQGECEAGRLACPFLMALHGNASTAQKSIDFWSPAASAGWLVAVPQSTQAMWKDSYVWNDLEFAQDEIQRHFEAVHKKYAIDLQRIVLAGHSMGGELAAWLAINGALPTRGFVLIGPGGPLTDEPESWVPLLQQAKGRNLRGYVIIGSEDGLILPNRVQEMVEIFRDGGIACELEQIPDAGHDFVPEYEPALLRGLDYVAGRLSG